MAGVANEGCEILDELRIASTVRIVAADAVVFDWFMDELKFFHFILHDDVTGKAKLAVIFDQKVLMVGTMGRVADRAFTDGDRTVQERHAVRRLVACGAELGNRFGRNQEFVFAAMGIVALRAIARH